MKELYIIKKDLPSYKILIEQCILSEFGGKETVFVDSEEKIKKEPVK